MKNKRSISVALILPLLMLAGCASETAPAPAPKPTKTIEPAPTLPPAPEPSVDTVIVGATELTVLDTDDEIVGSLPYHASPQEFIDLLAPIFGEDYKTEYSGEETCWYQMTTISWDEFKFSFSQQDLTTTKGVYVTLSAEEVSDAGVTVQSPNGAVVGGNYSQVLNVTEEKFTRHYEYEGVSYDNLVDEVSKETPSVYEIWNEETQKAETKTEIYYEGVIVSAKNGVVTNIWSPWYLDYDC